MQSAKQMTVGRMKGVDPGRDSLLPPSHWAPGASISVGNGENMKLTTFFYLFPWSRLYKAFPPLMYTFMAWYMVLRAQGQPYLFLKCIMMAVRNKS